MCARYSQTATPEQLERLLDVPMPEGLQPRYNIAPTQSVLAVITNRDVREARFLRWGLVPSWADDPAVGQRLINARAETAAEKPSFRHALRRQRCLIPATSFFEWQHLDADDEEADDARRDVADEPEQLTLEGLGAPRKPAVKKAVRKQPYVIKLRDGRPFAFAGLWERWHGPDDRPVETCAILTTDPNPLVARLHNRMPCILAPDLFDEWLDPANNDHAERLLPMLTAVPEDEMTAYPVSPEVGNPRHEGPELLRPIASAN
jgi:putative SOS response-associated peptidase YedK